MKKEYLKIKGVITEIGELVHIQREGIPDLYKKVLKTGFSVFLPAANNW